MSVDPKEYVPTLTVQATVGDEVLMVRPKVFSTGSKGWHANRPIIVDGMECSCNLLIVVKGSGPPKTGEQNSTAPKTPQDAPKTDSGRKTGRDTANAHKTP